MKKIALIIMALLMSISVTACNTVTSPEDGTKSASTTAEATDGKVTSEEKKNAGETASENKDDPKKDVSSETRKRFVEEPAARYGADEPEGYGIWYEGWANSSYVCVDYEGYECFWLEEGEGYESNVYNDVVLTHKGDIYRLRNASDGEIIFSTDSTDGMSMIIPEYYHDRQFADGYYLVYTKESSYSGATYKLGVIGPDGKWKVPLSKDHPLLTLYDSVKNIGKNVIYRGEGIMSAEVDREYYLYDIESNTVNKVISEADLSDSVIDSIFNCVGTDFRNGCAAGIYSMKKISFRLYSDGTLESKKISYHEDQDGTSGDTYYDSKGDRVIMIDASANALYDDEGNLVKKLNADIINVNGFTEEGTAQVVMSNGEDDYYYTVIDYLGNFAFEPVKVTSNYVYDADGNEISCVDTHAIDQGTNTVIADDGGILLETEYVYDFGMNNGVVCYKKDMWGDEIYQEL